MRRKHKEKFKYNSVTTIAFTVYHDREDGSDITDDSLLSDLLLRVADVSVYDGMLEATGGELVDTQEQQST